MRTLPKCLFGAALAVLAAVSIGCMHSPEAIRGRSLAAGKDLMRKGDYRRAILEFKNAVQAVPRDAECQYELGNAYAAGGDPVAAVAAYRKATELNPKHIEAQRKLAQFMAVLGDRTMVEDAEKRLQAVLDSSPADATALNALAFAELKLGKREDAIRHLEEVLSKGPQQLGTYMLLAQAKLEKADVKGAEEILQQACVRNPDSPEAFAVMGRFYSSLGRLADAESQFQTALRIQPKNAPALFYLGMLENAQGQKPQAEEKFKTLSTHPEKTYRPLYGMFLFQEGRKAEAVHEFERIYHSDPGDRAARTRLISVYQAVNRPEEAEKLIDLVLAHNPKDWYALLQRGTLRLEQGKYGDAQSDLNQVLHENPGMAEVHYLQARIYEKNGATLRQRQELNETLRLNSLFLPARIALARLLIRSNASQTALEVLDETPEQQKASLAVLVERNWVLAALGHLEAMQRGVQQGLTEQKTPDLLIQDAFLRLGKKDFAGTRALAEEALKASPEDVRGLELLLRSYSDRNQSAVALAKLQEYASQHRQSRSVQLFLGKWLLERGDKVGARAAFNAAKIGGLDSTESDLLLAQVDLLEAKWREARQEIAAMLTQNDGNITARYWLAQLEEIQGNHKASIEQYRRVIAADPGNTMALNNLAYLLLENGSPSEALPLAQRAKDLAPDNPTISDTLGWALYQNGLYSLAVKQLENANRFERNARRISHLSMAYLKAGTPDRARQMLQQALKLDPTLPDVRQAQALLSQRDVPRSEGLN